MDIELDIDTEIIGWDPIPPKLIWLDRVPSWFLHPFRKFFGRPTPSPREKWHLSLIFVKETMTILIEERKQREEFGYVKHDWGQSREPGKGGWN